MSWKGLSYLNEMFSLDLDTYEWEQISYASSNIPKPAYAMSCAAFNNKIYAHGGYGGYNEYYFWVFDIGNVTLFTSLVHFSL